MSFFSSAEKSARSWKSDKDSSSTTVKSETRGFRRSGAAPTGGVRESQLKYDLLTIPTHSGGAGPAAFAGRGPKISVKGFSVDSLAAERLRGDKSTEEAEEGESQDQSSAVTTFGASTSGVDITVEAQGVYTSPDFPDGFKWTQTIETNDPLHGAVSPYVDPHPNDDTKPFYWTDAEQATHPTTFEDHPSRSPPASDMTFWYGTLGLNGVDDSKKTAQGFDYLSYGFSIDSAGSVTTYPPSPADGTNSRSVLSSEFTDWIFN